MRRKHGAILSGAQSTSPPIPMFFPRSVVCCGVLKAPRCEAETKAAIPVVLIKLSEQPIPSLAPFGQWPSLALWSRLLDLEPLGRRRPPG